ncbi:MAG: hydroxymyristoyl-ACP dehydratase [Bacteroidota bacterium]|nr:hydroxymyristoyl-ACP dehydratase [Bacteroidota bacterium]
MYNKSVSEINVLDLIPQRAPVVMIDSLQYADTGKIISNFEITDGCIFCMNGFLSESGIIENIAQTGAAGFGYLDKLESKPVSLGFIASIKNLIINELPPAGSILTTEITIQKPVMGFNIIQGKVFLNTLIIANCEMRIFVKS